MKDKLWLYFKRGLVSVVIMLVISIPVGMFYSAVILGATETQNLGLMTLSLFFVVIVAIMIEGYVGSVIAKKVH